MNPTYSPSNFPGLLNQEWGQGAEQFDLMRRAGAAHAARIASGHGERLTNWTQDLLEIQKQMVDAFGRGALWNDAAAYGVDAAQRATLTVDVLRERANNDRAHEAAGAPPVLKYAYQVVHDGRDLPRPVNYMLLRIEPPLGVDVYDWKRPYMIIDPRAGHGAGIGGFKPDSQVGVALHGGHPVYFVVFRQHAEPGQTLADVMRAEAAFLREIASRHPRAPKPVVVGNCQGGWATLVLAAANPEITGPLVINGAPVATWSGQVGANPMRYNGGLLGGALPALVMADLGHGEFDGAHLVSNFEQLNPSRNFFGKYFDLYRDVEKQRESFLEFERWWGCYHFTNAAEIRWIVEQLFIGNRLARGEAELEPGRHLDLKAIQSPIIVFASKGDNITPPQQALNWIVDTYTDENEIRIRGQRIIYMLHEKVGHLGIFVSSSIARREHAEVSSTLKTIEALAPGLYEMTIEDSAGEGLHESFTVSFHERKVADIVYAVENERALEPGFGAVARLSELGTEVYDLMLRPFVQAAVAAPVSALLRDAHPSRLARRVFGDENPSMALFAAAADSIAPLRAPAAADNPFLAAEKLAADAVSQGMDLWRDLRDAAYEFSFLGIYGSARMQRLGESHAHTRTLKDPKELRYLPEVQTILHRIEHGGFVTAVVRMLILLAESRGSVRRDRLERSAEVLGGREPFAAMGADRRALVISEQAVTVEFERERALQTLPLLIAEPERRREAIDLVHYIVGARDEMEPQTLAMIERMERLMLGEVAVAPVVDVPSASPARPQSEAAQSPEAAVAPAPRPARKVARRKPTA
jgi:pimeloyl-ACP methyl ester carboxylesterase